MKAWYFQEMGRNERGVGATNAASMTEVARIKLKGVRGFQNLTGGWQREEYARCRSIASQFAPGHVVAEDSVQDTATWWRDEAGTHMVLPTQL